MEFTLGWRELLIAIILATLVYLLEVLLFSRRRRHVEAASKAPPGPPLEAELGQIREEIRSLRGRMDALEELLAKLPAAQPQPDDTPYGQAVRLARQGLSSQELAARCGISRGEAELIVALNRSES